MGKIVKQCSIILGNISYGKILKTEVGVAKKPFESSRNWKVWSRFGNVVLNMPERMAKGHITMTMEDWAKQIDIILEARKRCSFGDMEKITAKFSKYILYGRFTV